MIAALDPGRDKCGFAVLQDDGTVALQRVIATDDLEKEVKAAQEAYHFTHLVEGNGTTSKQARARIKQVLPELAITVINEYRTTELAKGEYWKKNPPKGWRRLLPVTMQVPPVPVDDFVAVILGRRYLNHTGEITDEC